MLNLRTSVFHDYPRQKIKYWVTAAIVFITVIKLNLLGSGFITFPDETRYSSSGKALQYLSELKIKNALNSIFSTQGRPGDAMLRTIPNAVQFLSAHLFKLEYYESKNSWPLFMFNYAVYLGILFVLFKFSKLILKDEMLALLSVLLYSSLTNSYLYLRHALPYDMGLLIFLLVIYKSFSYAESEQFSFKKSFLLGLSLFLGYLVYPGYIALLMISAFLFFFIRLNKKNLLNKIYHSLFYVSGSVFCLLIFEALSRLGGRSYITDAIVLSTTVIQGSFEESFEFIVKYFFQVEKAIGIFVLITLASFYVIIIHKIIKNPSGRQESIVPLAIIVLVIYLAYACVGYFMHQMVMYGRLLHQYLPFICIFSLVAIHPVIEKINVRKEIVIAQLLTFFTAGFAITFSEYKSIVYPRDIGWELLKKYDLKSIKNISEYDHSSSVIPSEKEIKRTESRSKFIDSGKEILVTNCFYFFPVEDLNSYRPYTPSDQQYTIMSKPHFIDFKAYQFEGFNVVERKNLDRLNFHIRVFSEKDSE